MMVSEGADCNARGLFAEAPGGCWFGVRARVRSQDRRAAVVSKNAVWGRPEPAQSETAPCTRTRLRAGGAFRGSSVGGLGAVGQEEPTGGEGTEVMTRGPKRESADKEGVLRTRQVSAPSQPDGCDGRPQHRPAATGKAPSHPSTPKAGVLGTPAFGAALSARLKVMPLPVSCLGGGSRRAGFNCGDEGPAVAVGLEF